MRLQTTDLDRYFRDVDTHISQQFDEPQTKFTVVAVGGTALALRKWKLSTKDVDFMVAGLDHERFKAWSREARPDVPADVWADTHVFSTTLPDDYAAEPYGSYKNFDVTLLSSLDVATTKLGRLNESDIEDIKTTVEKGTTRNQIIERAERMVRDGCYANAEEARSNIELFKRLSEDW